MAVRRANLYRDIGDTGLNTTGWGEIGDEFLREWQGAGEKVTLKLIAALRPQQLELPLTLDALGDDTEPQTLPKRDHRTRNRHAIRLAVTLHDEGTVNFQDVERKAFQVSQRGIAGAEIIEREAHADGFKRLEHLVGALIIVEEHAFGDFQFQPVRRYLRIGERIGDDQRQGRIGKLQG